MTEFTATTHMMDISTQPHSFDKYQAMTDSEVANHDMIKPKNNADVIPAVDVALTGRHLIEASAGTGKLALRLLRCVSAFMIVWWISISCCNG